MEEMTKETTEEAIEKTIEKTVALGAETEEGSGNKHWASFVEGDVANFFTGYKLEKMTLEDGNGNKAKLGRTKDCGIKIEYTSTVLI